MIDILKKFNWNNPSNMSKETLYNEFKNLSKIEDRRKVYTHLTSKRKHTLCNEHKRNRKDSKLGHAWNNHLLMDKETLYNEFIGLSKKNRRKIYYYLKPKRKVVLCNEHKRRRKERKFQDVSIITQDKKKLEQYEKNVLPKLLRWLKEKKNYEEEDLAFEYLKRHPYFMEFGIDSLEMLESLGQSLKANTDTDVLDKPNTINEYTSALEIIERASVRLFLYSGVDILGQSLIGKPLKKDAAKHEIDSYNFDLKINEKNTQFEYSHFYADSLAQDEKSSQEIKQKHILDVDIILGRGKTRWLEHLRPSLYIKMNPYRSVTRIREDFSKMMTLIKENHPEYMTSELSMNENHDYQDSFGTSGSQANSIIDLILYDLTIVLNIKTANLVEDFFQEIYEDNSTLYEKYEMHKYFANNDVISYKKNTLNNNNEGVLEKLGNGNFLKYVYSKKNISAHKELLKKNMINSIKTIHFPITDLDNLPFTAFEDGSWEMNEGTFTTKPNDEIHIDNTMSENEYNNHAIAYDKRIQELKSYEDFKDKTYSMILDVTRFSDKEVKKYSDTLFKKLSIDKKVELLSL